MIGIIGGSGVYEITKKADKTTKKLVKTDYGEVEVSILEIFSKEVAFIPRHASGHSIPPHKINFRANIDALKEELVNMRRIKRDSGKDSFELIPEKEGKLHDDRAYTYIMCCYHLHEKRMSNIRSKKKSNNLDIINMLPVTKGKSVDKFFG